MSAGNHRSPCSLYGDLHGRYPGGAKAGTVMVNSRWQWPADHRRWPLHTGRQARGGNHNHVRRTATEQRELTS